MRYTTRFSNDLSSQKIRSIFLVKRFGKYPTCPRCNSDRIKRTDSCAKWRCRKCHYRFGITTGTFLNRKRIPLRLWYEIAYGFATSQPAYRLQKILKVKDYKTVYGGYKTIRQALVQNSQTEFERLKFYGITEVDESYYGGKFKNLRKDMHWKLRKLGLAKRGRGAKYRKQPVFGIYRRDGKIYLELVSDTKRPVLERIIKERVEKGGKVFSDTHRGYQELAGLGYLHKTVNHGREEYIRGKVHINGVEGFWGLSKTNMFAYKGIRKKNWNGYLKEMEFRYNNRNLEYDDSTLKIIAVLCQKVAKSSFDS